MSRGVDRSYLQMFDPSFFNNSDEEALVADKAGRSEPLVGLTDTAASPNHIS